MMQKKLIFFLVFNFSIAFCCLEFWREGQPPGRMVLVAVVSLLVLNLIAWVVWQRTTRRQ
jgi:hypothetical protein